MLSHGLDHFNVTAISHFQQRILNWYGRHGRKNLPWQKTKSAYHVWLSEIMLQQTQVATVIPYFERFIQRFPNLDALANAQLDEVLSLWAGLGYYARGRNLHRCAQIIKHQYSGHFPQTVAELEALPGIGRSTAGAIRSLGFDQTAAILDGNVKRVLTRFHALSGWPGLNSVSKKLWELAEQYTPTQQAAAYTQAMMDMGALICTRAQPKCCQCPLQSDCLAYNTSNPTQFPSPKPSKTLPIRAIQMLLLVNQQQEILLEKRPPSGIWGGLWSLPECPLESDSQAFAKKYYYCDTETASPFTHLRHTFSHFQLDIQAVSIRVKKWQPPLMESERIVWYNLQQLQKKGLASPVKKLIQQLNINNTAFL